MGRNKYAQHEIDIIGKLLKRKCAGTPGYAPLEQSSSENTNQFTPSMDVYGLGASFYKMLTNMTPPKAMEIVANGINALPLVSKNVSQQSIDAIKAAMNPDAEKRIQTIDEFLAVLQVMEEDVNEEKTGRMSRYKKTAFILVVLAMIIIAVLYFAL